ncbi:ketopantoate reductase family protein [Lacisediminimonas sp.]|uniref:ketopantoate reductase family protein n=1 Tax=Lacisediminimonas sp. TaxID=3060582 RepID=UPI002725D226|nr:2-dehydropantoate 2-reductase [Lacisediminimonas sp.]MDO8301442.1 2-dehydropantoate 2-reductase [Lacisediminimonas sp.]
MKILILGAGGVGGYFGARLQEAGADVTWLVRPQRLQALRRDGLRIESPLGNLHLAVQAVTSDTATPDYDLIMLASKAYDLDDALASLARAMAGKALLLPFLNGLSHLALLDRRYGRERVAGGVAHIAATQRPDATVVQLSALHSLMVGSRAPAQEALVKEFFALCQGARFDAVLADDIEQQLWNKWTFLATLAGATTLYRGSIGKIMASEEGAALVDEMYEECLSVAAAWGQRVPAENQSRARSLLLQRDSDFTASMYRDLLSGQRTEHEHVLGEMCRMAQERGLATPLMRAAWCHMQVENP